jgi:histidyl-tRNA synthetase
MVALLADGLRELGLTGIEVLLNSVGDGVCRPAFTGELRRYLSGAADRLCPDCLRRTEQNPLRVLDCKVPECRTVVEGMPSIQGHLCEACREHQSEVIALLTGASLAYRIEDRLVRGLDYYTRTVFEVQHGGLGAQSAVGGGGRYDGLVEEVGGPPTAGVGFSSGVERILLALEAEGAPLPGPERPDVAVVVVGGVRERRAGMLLALRLRRRYRVEADVAERSMNQQMKQANRLGARLVVVVGEGELADNRWTVKDMATGEQAPVEDAGLEAAIERLLAAGTERS